MTRSRVRTTTVLLAWTSAILFACGAPTASNPRPTPPAVQAPDRSAVAGTYIDGDFTLVLKPDGSASLSTTSEVATWAVDVFDGRKPEVVVTITSDNRQHRALTYWIENGQLKDANGSRLLNRADESALAPPPALAKWGLAVDGIFSGKIEDETDSSLTIRLGQDGFLVVTRAVEAFDLDSSVAQVEKQFASEGYQITERADIRFLDSNSKMLVAFRNPYTSAAAIGTHGRCLYRLMLAQVRLDPKDFAKAVNSFRPAPGTSSLCDAPPTDAELANASAKKAAKMATADELRKVSDEEGKQGACNSARKASLETALSHIEAWLPGVGLRPRGSKLVVAGSKGAVEPKALKDGGQVHLFAVAPDSVTIKLSSKATPTPSALVGALREFMNGSGDGATTAAIDSMVVTAQNGDARTVSIEGHGCALLIYAVQR